MRLLGGIGAAVLIAALASDVTLSGVALWKIALALLGLGLFVLAGRAR